MVVRKHDLYRDLTGEDPAISYRTFHRRVKEFLYERGIEISRSHFFTQREAKLIREEW